MLNEKCYTYWAEADHLTVDAALDYWCGYNPECREAKKFAIIAACERKEIQYARTDGRDFRDPVLDLIGRGILVLERESFERWAKRVDTDPDLHLPGKLSYLNVNHQFHAKELKIAVETWAELYDKNPPDSAVHGGHKKYILDWLEENYKNLGSNARDRIATIINPNPKGGASPTSDWG